MEKVMLEKLLILHTPNAHIVPHGAEKILEALYGALNALDTTASALLIFNSVLFAAAAFAADKMNDRLLRRWVILMILIALLAAGMCLRVAHISYPFYHEVIITSGPPQGLDFTREFKALQEEVDYRTCLFQTAWYLSVIAVGMSCLAIIYRVLTENSSPAAPNDSR
jgi:hypothetical protein